MGECGEENSNMSKMRRRIGLILMRLTKDEIDEAFIAVNDIFMKSEAYTVFQSELEASRHNPIREATP